MQLDEAVQEEAQGESGTVDSDSASASAEGSSPEEVIVEDEDFEEEFRCTTWRCPRTERDLDTADALTGTALA